MTARAKKAAGVLAGVAALATALVTIASPAPALADRGGDAGARHDPENVTAISVYMETLVKGNERYAAKDYAGAAELDKKAIALAPKNPLGHYLLGEAHLATNDLKSAEASFHEAETLSDSKNPRLRSHVLFAVADCFEREKKWPEAQKAWQAYAEHAAKFGDAGAFPASGAARLAAIQKVLELEKAYVAVRARIAAEGDGGADAAAKK